MLTTVLHSPFCRPRRCPVFGRTRLSMEWRHPDIDVAEDPLLSSALRLSLGWPYRAQAHTIAPNMAPASWFLQELTRGFLRIGASVAGGVRRNCACAVSDRSAEPFPAMRFSSAGRRRRLGADIDGEPRCLRCCAGRSIASFHSCPRAEPDGRSRETADQGWVLGFGNSRAALR